MTFAHKLSCRLALIRDALARLTPVVAVLSCETPAAIPVAPDQPLTLIAVVPDSLKLDPAQQAKFAAYGRSASGDSVAVSGVCLTALAIRQNSFSADLAPETWIRTSFSRVKPEALVNLELPMRVDGRLGGHLVQGHVDGVGKLIAFEPIPESENWWLRIHIPDELDRYVVYKGSIAIEGIGLTVAKLDSRCCTVAIIPHTVEATNLKTLKPGARRHSFWT